MKTKRLFSMLTIFAVVGFSLGAQASLPKGPTFKSELVAPKDEGTVTPVAKKPAKPIKIAILGLENNPFWVDVKAGASKANEELKALGASADWIVPGDQHTTDVFGRAIEAAMAQGYSAIATIAGDSGMVNYINRAVDKGIPIATFNSETTATNKRLFFVGADSYKQGQTGAENMARILNKRGKVAIITGFFSVEDHELRRKGFIETLKKLAPNIQIVSNQENHDKADEAYALAQNLLAAYPDLAGIYVTAGGNFGAAKALDEAGKAGVIHLIVHDFVPEAMEYVKAGVIDGTIGQDPFAQGHDPAIRLYNYLVAGLAPPAGRLLTRADFVTKENMDQFYKPVQ